MVRQWAEKEYRNLKRLAVNGIRSPIPIELRGHVIAMTFLGSDEGLRAPKLKELLKLKPSPPSVSYINFISIDLSVYYCYFSLFFLSSDFLASNLY